jgi:hypothetical protein
VRPAHRQPLRGRRTGAGVGEGLDHPPEAGALRSGAACIGQRPGHVELTLPEQPVHDERVGHLQRGLGGQDPLARRVLVPVRLEELPGDVGFVARFGEGGSEQQDQQPETAHRHH